MFSKETASLLATLGKASPGIRGSAPGSFPARTGGARSPSPVRGGYDEEEEDDDVADDDDDEFDDDDEEYDDDDEEEEDDDFDVDDDLE